MVDAPLATNGVDAFLDIDAYLRNRKQRMGKETEQVGDPPIFDFNYILDRPLMRDECRALIDENLLSTSPASRCCRGVQLTRGG
jgi:hypothetical protein